MAIKALYGFLHVSIINNNNNNNNTYLIPAFPHSRIPPLPHSRIPAFPFPILKIANLIRISGQKISH